MRALRGTVLKAALLAALCMPGPGIGAETATAHAASAVLEQGFRFASAIRSDAKDRSAAQERVVLEYATSGALDEAARLADKIEGWERGVAYAEIAALLAKEGRGDDARGLIRKAEEFRGTISGWQSQRIAAHVANAHAALGAVEPAASATTSLASDRQYGGRARATLAAAYAAAGDLDKAMAELASLDELEAAEDCIWRSRGYLAIAAQERFDVSRRLDALARARRSAEAVPGWLKAEPLVEIAGAYRALGRIESAREVLGQAEEVAEAIPATAPLSAPIRSGVAQEWARLGKRDRARALLARAEATARATPDVGRPYIIAAVAAGYHVLGDRPSALRLLDRAFSEVRAQVNARPRALAVVEICRTMARYGMPLTETTRATLEALYAGLTEPW